MRLGRRLRWLCVVAVWCMAAVGVLGCVDAKQVPTEPLQANVQLATYVADWRDEVIYQVLTDRFHDGDVNNNYNIDLRAPARYHGGDWQGLIDKLDYLQALGVTALWITPVVRNVEEDAGFASYHGYWTQDFVRHNPHFGELQDLRRLADALHARNMKLILDVVTNHIGQAFFYDINGNGRPDEFLSGSTSMDNGEPLGRIERLSEYDPDFDRRGIQGKTSLGESGPAPVIFFDVPAINRVPPQPRNIDLDGDGKITNDSERLGFSNPEWYHRKGRVTNWDSNPPAGYPQGEQTLLGDFPGGLKDIATERADVRQAMKIVFSYWIDASDADGFRIDTLKHVEYEFWREWAPYMRQHAALRGKRNFFMFGEVFDGRDDLLGGYTGPDQVDSVFYFSQKFRVFDNLFKCPAGNQAPYCRNGDGSFRRSGTQAIEALLADRVANYNATPQPGGVTDESGQGLSAQQLLVNFLDNHDVSRYLFDRLDQNALASLHSALFYLLTQDGIPCLYYGTEQAFFGGNDPANREDMYVAASSLYTRQPFAEQAPNYQAWSQDNPTFLHIQRLTGLRRQYAPLRRGDFTLRWTSDRTGDEQDAGILAFERALGADRVLVVINTHEAQEGATTFDGASMQTGFPPNTTLTDAYSGQGDYVVDAEGRLSISVPPMTGRVLVPR
jgi:alpha-amylase